ncbi:MAG: S8 family serine peptidase [archaeon]
MVYKRYVRKGGKVFGPYYYESYRDGEKVRKKYFGSVERKSNWRKGLMFGLLAFVFLLVVTQAGFNLIGFLVYDEEIGFERLDFRTDGGKVGLVGKVVDSEEKLDDGGNFDGRSVLNKIVDFFKEAFSFEEIDFAPGGCFAIGGVQVVGSVVGSNPQEASGVAASIRNPNVLWTHDDSGGAPVVFAISGVDASFLGTTTIASSFSDAEDIATAGGPVPGTGYIYLGDIGDNSNNKGYIRVFRTPEPIIDIDGGSSQNYNLVSLTTIITLYFPSGEDAPAHKNSETLIVDPITLDIYIVTKGGVPNSIYRASFDCYNLTNTCTMDLIAHLPSTFDGNGNWDDGPTGGDISPDGSMVAIRQYSSPDRDPNVAVWYRPAGSSDLSYAFVDEDSDGVVDDGSWCAYDIVPDGTNEAIGFDAEGLGWYTIPDEVYNPADPVLRYYTLTTSCGDNYITPDEECDVGVDGLPGGGDDLFDPSTLDCNSVSGGFTGGNLACASNCFDFDTGGCVEVSVLDPVCLSANVLCVDDSVGSFQEYSTIQAAADVAVAGDVVLVKEGVYVEEINLPRGGTLGNEITFKAFSGDRPVLDGQNLLWAGFQNDNKDYIVIEGFEIRDYTNSCIYLVNDANYNTIRYNLLHGSMRGVYLRGADYFNVRFNEIYNCTVGIETNWRDTTSNWAENGIINDNLVYGNRRIMAGSDGIQGAGSINTIFDGNVLYYNIDDGIDVSSGGGGGNYALNATVRNNIAFNQGNSSDPANGGNGIKVSTNAGGDHKIYGNVVFNNTRGGFDQDKASGWPQNFFVNNLAYGNGYGTPENTKSGFVMDFPGGDPDEDAVLKNNIGADNSYRDIYNNNGDSVNESDYNFWADGNFVAGMDVNSLSGDVMFNSSYMGIDLNFGVGWTIEQKLDYVRGQVREIFSLRSGSGAIDAGALIEGYHCDSAGEVGDCRTWYGLAPDMGAFEYIGGVCGNSVVEAGEECDDGDIEPSDGCDESCQNESCIFISGYWNPGTPLVVGDGVQAVVDTNGKCFVPREINFTIYEETGDVDIPARTQPSLRPAIFPSAVWYSSAGDEGSQFYFNASMVDDSSISAVSGLLNVTGTCVVDTDCDDGLDCTDDVCNVETDSCNNIVNDANCVDEKICDDVLGCVENPIVSCVLGNVYWDRTEALTGEEVGIVVSGTGCDGVDLNITIYNESGEIVDDSVRGSFVGDIVETSWATDISVGRVGRYFFVASLEEGIGFSGQSGRIFVREGECVDADGDGIYDYDEGSCGSGEDNCVEEGFVFDGNFTLNNTLFETVNFSLLSDLTNVSLNVSFQGKMRIDFRRGLSLANVDENGCFVFPGIDFDRAFYVSDTKVSVDSSFYRVFDVPARIYFYGMYSSPTIFKNGEECRDCILLDVGVDSVKYEVPGFTSYEIVECGDSVCNGDESCSTCSLDCGACPPLPPPGGSSSSSSSGGSSVTLNNQNCSVEWRCIGWSECANGIQVRTCSDVNNCNVSDKRPNEVQECEMSVEGMDGEGEQEGQETERLLSSKFVIGLVLILIIIVLLVVIVLMVIKIKDENERLRKRKEVMGGVPSAMKYFVSFLGLFLILLFLFFNVDYGEEIYFSPGVSNGFVAGIIFGLIGLIIVLLLVRLFWGRNRFFRRKRNVRKCTFGFFVGVVLFGLVALLINGNFTINGFAVQSGGPDFVLTVPSVVSGSYSWPDRNSVEVIDVEIFDLGNKYVVEFNMAGDVQVPSTGYLRYLSIIEGKWRRVNLNSDGSLTCSLCSNPERQGSVVYFEVNDVFPIDGASISVSTGWYDGSVLRQADSGSGTIFKTVGGEIFCGDGVKEGDEVCDDGNLVSCDGCGGDCYRMDKVCGDGIKECGEGCDDGNLADDDECSSLCEVEEQGVCVEEWICGDWGECVDGVRVRECGYFNNCGTENGKPEVSKECGCVEGQERNCGSDVGVCLFGTETCVNGDWGECVGEVEGEEEICDGFDNDCDGNVDESCETNGGEDDRDGSDGSHGEEKECETGEREESLYCYYGEWFEQKEDEEDCSNDYECLSKECFGGVCISSSLVDKIVEWLRGLFGFISIENIAGVSEEGYVSETEFNVDERFGLVEEGGDYDVLVFEDGDGIEFNGYIVVFDEEKSVAEVYSEAEGEAGIEGGENPDAGLGIVREMDREEVVRRAVGAMKEEIRENQEEFEKELEAVVPEAEVVEKFQLLDVVVLDNVEERDIEKIKKMDGVANVVPNLVVKAFLDESVPYIKADDVWRMDAEGNDCVQSGEDCLTGEGIVIAVLDTGVDYTHPDLGGCTTEEFLSGECEKVIGGYDFINNDNDPFDDHGHGTHCAATAVGEGVAGDGTVLKGVAPDARIVAYKVLNEEGSGSALTILRGIEAAMDPNGDGDFSDHVDVISMSLGAICGSYSSYCGPDDVLSSKIDDAAIIGVVPVISAGNSGFLGRGTIGTPGTAREAVTVAAVYKKDYDEVVKYSACEDDFPRNDQITCFSSRGPVELPYSSEIILKPDIAAPGADICAAQHGIFALSRECKDDKHVAIAGTSMAAPHVAGAAALLKQQNPDWAPYQIKEALISGARYTENDLYEDGAGVLDVLASSRITDVSSGRLLLSPGGVIYDSVEVTSVFSDENFERFVLEYKLVDGAEWNLIEESEIYPLDGLIYYWDTSEVPDEYYILRLTVYRTDGSVQEGRRFIAVDNFGFSFKVVVGMSLRGEYDILGRVTRGADYVLEYGLGSTANPDKWHPIVEKSEYPEDGVLYNWDTRRAHDGLVTLRLTALRNGEVMSIEDTSGGGIIEIDNIYMEEKTRPWVLVGEELEIYATIDNEIYDHYVLEIAPGREATDGFSTGGIALENVGQGPVFDELIGTWDSSSFESEKYYTIRLKVYGRDGSLIEQGETKGVYLMRERAEGWPLTLSGVSQFWGSPRIEDLDGDGFKEVIIVHEDWLYVLSHDGVILPGWPVYAPNAVWMEPSIGDVDGDGVKEIVFPSAENTEGHGEMNVYNLDGNEVSGWPQEIQFRGVYVVSLGQPNPTIADIDGNGDMEIIFIDDTASEDVPTKMHVWNHDGLNYPGNWPIDISDLYYGAGKEWCDLVSGFCTVSVSSVAVGDVVPGGGLEMVVRYTTNVNDNTIPGLTDNTGYVAVYDTYGMPVSGWPREIEDSSHNVLHWEPAIGDVDNDGNIEIVGLGYEAWGDTGIQNRFIIYNRDGSIFREIYPDFFGDEALRGTSSFILGDILGDGNLEIIALPNDGQAMYVVDMQGNEIWTAKLPAGIRIIPGAYGPSPILADVNGDGIQDVVQAARASTNNYFGQIFPPTIWAFDGRTGKVLEGFPLFLPRPIFEDIGYDGDQGGVNSLQASPSIADIDSDGKLEIVVGGADGKVHVIDLDSDNLGAFHPTVMGDNSNTNFVSNRGECSGAECSHSECVNRYCVIVNGVGADECYNDLGCFVSSVDGEGDLLLSVPSEVEGVLDIKNVEIEKLPGMFYRVSLDLAGDFTSSENGKIAYYLTLPMDSSYQSTSTGMGHIGVVIFESGNAYGNMAGDFSYTGSKVSFVVFDEYPENGLEFDLVSGWRVSGSGSNVDSINSLVDSVHVRLDSECGNGIKEADEKCDGFDFGDYLDGTCYGYSSFFGKGNLVCSGCAIESSQCSLSVCGDGLLHRGEECDDGNLADGDGCDSSCHVEESCVDCRHSVCVNKQCVEVLGYGEDECDYYHDCPDYRLFDEEGDVDPSVPLEYQDSLDILWLDIWSKDDFWMEGRYSVKFAGEVVPPYYEVGGERDLYYSGEKLQYYLEHKDVGETSFRKGFNVLIEPYDKRYCLKNGQISTFPVLCRQGDRISSAFGGVMETGPNGGAEISLKTYLKEAGIRQLGDSLDNVFLVDSNCGDGNLGEEEFCDDGNLISCDGCRNDCSRADGVCGDGIKECGEECDDGNLIDGDGCSSLCEVEEAECVVDEDCGDDGNVCNGEESCVSGECVGGVALDCDDGVGCTVDYCDPVNGCIHTMSDGVCGSDELYCNGREFCDGVLDCQVAAVNCPDGEWCDEEFDMCVEEPDCFSDEDCGDDGNVCTDFACSNGKCEVSYNANSCEDGLFCTVGDRCLGGVCVGGRERDCDDEVGCTEDECDEFVGECVSIPQDVNCFNGAYCDGVEICDSLFGCQAGTNPCSDGEYCSEGEDMCPILECFPNSVKSGTEQCDGDDFGGLNAEEVCKSENYPSGGVAICTDDCIYDLSGCSLAPVFGSFDGNTTNFTDVGFVFEDAVLENRSYGMINFSGSVINFNRLDLDRYVFIGNKKISVDTSGYGTNRLNVPAVLSFYGIGFREPRVLKDGADCVDCEVVNYSNGIYVLNVAGFSVYEVVEGWSEPPCVGCGGGGGGTPQCRDGRDNDGDNLTDYPDDPGCTSRGDNSEFDFSEVSECVEEWSCRGWSECVSGKQTRVCVRIGECEDSETEKPNEVQECEMSVGGMEGEGGEQEEPGILRLYGKKVLIGLFVILGIMIVVIIVVLIFAGRGRKIVKKQEKLRESVPEDIVVMGSLR